MAEGARRMLSADRAAQVLVEGSLAVTDAEIERFYRDNPAHFHRPEQLRLRVLQVRAAPGARERIEALRARLAKGEDFDALARRESDHPTRPWGGALDPVSRGALPAPLDAAAFGLQPGELSPVVEAPDGLYVLRLEERLAAVTVPLEAARERIREHLAQARGREVLDREVAALRAASKVEVLLPQ
ncbi:MAG: peptidylprolyl isomerase [Betaproteobacteria bacterium]|nr:peptidylprolyl isomerase [Betaproteobacteria bacterium]